MRTTISWGDGTGDNIYLDYTEASGNQTILVSSDANSGTTTRTKDILFSASGVTSVTLSVRQYPENTDIVIITRNDVYPTYNETAVGYVIDTPTPTIEPIQIVVNGDFADGLSGWSIDTYCTATIQSEGIRIAKKSGTTRGGILYQSPSGLSTSKKYYQKAVMRRGTDTACAGFCTSSFTVGSQLVQMYVDDTTWTTIDQITKASGSANKLCLRCGSSSSASGVWAEFKSFMIIDLTATFGEGNEPTIEECRQLFPNDYYPTKTS